MSKRTVTDQMHRTVEVPRRPARIVSLVPSQTELLAYLGLEKEVVGITKFCVHPESWFRSKRRVGGTKHIKPEQIEALEPDLIIGNKEENVREQIESLTTNYPVWMSEVNTLEDALHMIRAVGDLTGTPARAEALAGEIARRFDELTRFIAGSDPVRAAYFIWRRPHMVAGRDTFINDMLQRAGFYNVWASRARYPEVELDQLRSRQTQAILLSSEPYPFKEKHYDEFRLHCPGAALELVDGELFSWYGSRLLRSASYFRQLHLKVRKALQR